MKYLSVCISTHEMGGKGSTFLEWSLDRLIGQTYKDFEVIISDQSDDDLILNVCNKYKSQLDIKYFKEPTGRRASSVNINNAIKNANGRLIKIIFLDDYPYHKNALQDIVDNFDINKDHWLVTASIHTRDGIDFYRPFHPKYDDETILFKNSISSPSVLTIKNDNPILFDENLIWWMDLDYYKRCFDKYGPPIILDKINVVNREGPHQVTNTTATDERREREFKYILNKFKVPHRTFKYLKYKTRRYMRNAKHRFLQ